ncbi:hypothetical protein MYAM1_003965 [Malassezia yamatoensis]|uniref:Uncharacterized protein n=1 Tax=Malassezia yamatoensis TaxID=253288 RepID=A0AAJ6CIA8_9BASI|nr:hypothetical protein MYAM1_003965 [Malassezia yamatoensis]
MEQDMAISQRDYPYFDASDSSTSNDGSLKKSFSAFGLDKEREEKDYLEQESDRLGTSPVTPDLITFKHVFYERPTRIIDMQVLHSKSDKEPVLFGFNEKTPKADCDTVAVRP